MNNDNRLLVAAGSGLAGACALTLLHETVRQFVPNAPRADILGMRAIANGFRAAHEQPPAREPLHRMALAADIVSNALYYSLIGTAQPTNALLTGAALGTAAGVGGVLLPGPMGLGEAPTTRTPATVAMTIGWYLTGGLVAATVYRLLSK